MAHELQKLDSQKRTKYMSIQNQFNKFHDAIKLTRESDSYKAAREKDDSIKEDIKKAFKEEGYPVINDFLQGSHSTDTGVNSLVGDRDVDRAIVIDIVNAPDDPVDPKKTIRDVLKKRGFSDRKIKKPCVTANYASDDLHFDYPVYKSDALGNLEIAIGKEFSGEAERYWDGSDPKGLSDYVNDKNGNLTDKERAQFRRIVRYLKRWRDERYASEQERKKVYSIGLTLMARACLASQIDEEGRANDLLALRETVYAILHTGGFFTLTDAINEKYDVKVNLPVKPWRDVFEKNGSSVGTQLRSKFLKLISKCDDALAEENVIKQSEIMRSQLGDDFPIPEKNDSVRKNVYVGGGLVSDHGGA